MNCTKPSSIIIATRLLLTSLILVPVLFALDWSSFSSEYTMKNPDAAAIVSPLTHAIITNFLGSISFGWLFYKISTGRNWARIIYLLITISGIAAIFPSMQWNKIFEHSIFIGLLTITNIVVQLVALYLIFFGKDAAGWFRKSRKLPSAAAA